MKYEELKNIVEAIDDLKSLSFDTLKQVKEWAIGYNWTRLVSEKPDYIDFDYKMLSGTFYKRDDGQIELCENITAYDEEGEPKMDIELY